MGTVALAADVLGMEPRPFPAVLRAFDRHLDVIGRADATRRQYRYELVRWWIDYLYPAELEVAEVRSCHVEEYLVTLPRQGSRRIDAIRALRALCSWAQTEGELDRNPIAHIPVPRPRQGPAPDLPEDHLRRLLRAAFRREPRRGWAILLCYVTGARVGSLVAAKPSDVHLGESPRIDLLEAKGGKPYSVPLERAGVLAATHLQRSATVGDRLIGVGAERFRQWVHAAEQEAGLGRIYPHLLRHAMLTRAAHAEGVSPEEVRRLANWADLSQWPRYVAGRDEALRRGVRAAFSRAGPLPMGGMTAASRRSQSPHGPSDAV